MTLFYVTLFVAALAYRYPLFAGNREGQAFGIALLFLGAMLLEETEVRNQEHFDSPQVAQPLEIDNNIMVNPIGWRWTNETTITTQVRFTVNKGECDYENLVGRPGLGFPSKSDGFGYTTWNRMQGNNAWFAWNEGTGGTGWFWWKPTAYWHNLSSYEKAKMLELDLMITNVGVVPAFPVGYSITCPDANFSRSVRVWVQFTRNPMADMSHPFEQAPDKRIRHDRAPPLQVEHTTLTIPADKWTILNQETATLDIPIKARQGGIDWTMIKGADKHGRGWFSWSINANSHIQSRSKVVLSAKLHQQLEPPAHFPAHYLVEIKDAHRDRYVRVNIVLLNNPFVKYIGKLETTPESKICPEQTRLSTLRTSCQLPLLIRTHLRDLNSNQ
jgi:hypothetical protein